MTMKTPLILALASVTALTACDPSTTGGRDRATTGAIAGAAIGGILGAASGDKDKLGKAVIGAGVGAVLGAAVGASLDAQAQDLERSIGDDRVRIVNTGSELIVTMPQDILFAVDSAALRSDLVADLNAVARNLQKYPDTTVQVVGHTDNTGSAEYNLDLSQRRADAVAAELRAGGVSSGRIVAYGRGESQPVASNLTEEGRAQNRRVEIVIRPIA
ncbi:MAG: OmpA family protein [Rhodobacterales bacterium]|nr:OmpA family protein [Rhodobacterales bacterium]